MLIPEKLEIALTKPPTLSPKIAESTVVISELLDEPPNKLPRIPLEAAPVIAFNTPGLSALFAIPPTTAGNSALIALEIPDSLSPNCVAA